MTRTPDEKHAIEYCGVQYSFFRNVTWNIRTSRQQQHKVEPAREQTYTSSSSVDEKQYGIGIVSGTRPRQTPPTAVVPLALYRFTFAFSLLLLLLVCLLIDLIHRGFVCCVCVDHKFQISDQPPGVTSLLGRLAKNENNYPPGFFNFLPGGLSTAKKIKIYPSPGENAVTYGRFLSEEAHTIPFNPGETEKGQLVAELTPGTIRTCSPPGVT